VSAPVKKAIITFLSGCARGAPLTTTRHYALVPLANKELILHQHDILTEYEVAVLVKKDPQADPRNNELLAFLHDHDLPVIHDLPKEAALLLPGDLLPTKPAQLTDATTTTLLTTPDGSEETDAARALLTDKNIHEVAIDAQRLNYPWEFLTANTALLRRRAQEQHDGEIAPGATIEDGVTIHGAVIIGEGTVIRAGSYIEGPVVIGKDCTIGPFAHLRPDTSIADGCTIGKTETVDCIILRGTVSKHHAYLGHSVLGEDVNIGAFTVTADYRHDGQEHRVWVAGEKVASGRRKVGAFIGDHARLAISTSIYPGRKLGPGTTTLPGEVVTKDKGLKENKGMIKNEE